MELYCRVALVLNLGPRIVLPNNNLPQDRYSTLTYKSLGGITDQLVVIFEQENVAARAKCAEETR